MNTPELEPRIAGPDDAATITGIMTRAFHDDPTWSHAFPDPQTRPGLFTLFWGTLVEGALRYPWTWLTPGDTAASVWIPPGREEMAPDREAEFLAQLAAALGPGPDLDRVLATFEAFDTHHPHDVPHYYLTLLATEPASRGQGLGLGLLGDNLRRIDAEHMPAYLEASSVANVPLYQRYGFQPTDSFFVPDGGPEVVTMWRPAA
jgi:GNAT superfamily N-acetyltransferase